MVQYPPVVAAKPGRPNRTRRIIDGEEAVRQWSPTQVRENLPALLSQMQAEGAVKYTPPAPRT